MAKKDTNQFLDRKWLAQNDICQNWTQKITRLLKGSAAKLTKGKNRRIQMSGQKLSKKKLGSVIRINKKTKRERDEAKLVDSLKGITRKSEAYGVVNRISFSFERHGVFVQKGVGKGYKMSNGNVIKVTPGPKNRHPVDWFNSIIDSNTDALANDLARVNADAAINSMRLRIN